MTDKPPEFSVTDHNLRAAAVCKFVGSGCKAEAVPVMGKVALPVGGTVEAAAV